MIWIVFGLAAAWAKYMRATPEADTHDVLVCHGNVIRWFVSRALGPDTWRWSQMEIANAADAEAYLERVAALARVQCAQHHADVAAERRALHAHPVG